MSEHVRKEAEGFVALPESDPGKRAAYAHATGCPDCARALSDAERLLNLLAAAPHQAPPSAEGLRRTSAAVLAEMDRDLASVRAPWRSFGQGRWPLPMSVLITWLVVISLEGAAQADRATLAASALLGAVALTVAFGALARGWRFVTVGLVGSGLFSLLAALRGSARQDLAISLGTKCAIFELVAMVIPFGVAIYLVARKRTEHIAAALAGGAMSGAMAGQAALHFGCPHRGIEHLLVFHTGAVVVAAGLGAASSILARLIYRAR